MGPKGRPVKQAEVLQPTEHNINLNLVSRDAIGIIDRLQRRGYQGYIVGGAVRDLLTGRKPKDFDIVTNAKPEEVRKIFRNSRIIGKRFKLVHIFYQDTIYEVATFRSLNSFNDSNDYGTIEEDVQRRDFTINALYYDPVENIVIDYINGVKDLKNRKLKSLIDLKITFKEDPVRIIRGIKYSKISNLKIPFNIKSQIKKDADLIDDVSISRLTEEAFKILLSGCSRDIIECLINYNVFEHLFPELGDAVYGKNRKEFLKDFYSDLDRLDKKIHREEENAKALALSYLLESYITGLGGFKNKNIIMNDFVKLLKDSFKPLIAPNVDVETAARFLLKRKNIRTTAKRRYVKRGNRQGYNKFKKKRRVED